MAFVLAEERQRNGRDHNRLEVVIGRRSPELVIPQALLLLGRQAQMSCLQQGDPILD